MQLKPINSNEPSSISLIPSHSRIEIRGKGGNLARPQWSDDDKGLVPKDRDQQMPEQAV